MSKKLAQFLSYLLHPAIVPALATFIILGAIPGHIPQQQVWYITLFVLLSTYFMPAVFSVLMKTVGLIQSLHMSDPRDRRYPFIVSIIFFLFTAHTLGQQGAPIEIVRVLLSSAMTITLFFTLLRFTKLSVHLAGMGGLTATCVYLSHHYEVMMLEIIAIVILFSGLLATARLVLKAHTMSQVILGYSAGLIITFLALLY